MASSDSQQSSTMLLHIIHVSQHLSYVIMVKSYDLLLRIVVRPSLEIVVSTF